MAIVRTDDRPLTNTEEKSFDMATHDPTALHASAPDDTAPAGTLTALALLLEDPRTDAEALRELLAGAEPTALHGVLADALALLSWRCDFGQRLAGHVGAPCATAAQRFIRPAVLARAEAAA